MLTNLITKDSKKYVKKEIPSRIEMSFTKNISEEVFHLYDWECTVTLGVKLGR
jgi:hypothetical protein